MQDPKLKKEKELDLNTQLENPPLNEPRLKNYEVNGGRADFASIVKYSTLTNMADNIQFLGVVSRLFPQILSGEKTSTIRWQERHILAGPMKFICDENPNQTVEVEVLRCTNMPLSEAASFVGKTNEWPDQIMLEGMREHYPNIQLTSIVQVIEFNPPAQT